MSIFDGDFWGVGGNSFPNGKKKSNKSGYCEACNRHHSVDFVHDVMGPIIGVAVLGLTLSTLSGFLGSNQG